MQTKQSLMSKNAKKVKRSTYQKGKFPFPKIPSSLIEAGRTIRIYDVFPDDVLVEMKYSDQTSLRTNLGVSFASWRYRMTSPYDPDPALLTGAVTGFTEWSNIYSTYRVIGFGYEVSISNNEAFPLQLFVAPTLFDIGLNSLSTPDLGEIRMAQEGLISAKGGQDRRSFTGYVNLRDFAGASFVFDPKFNSSTSGNPGTNLYFNVGLFAGLTNTFTALGVNTAIRVWYHCLFYQRKDVFM